MYTIEQYYKETFNLTNSLVVKLIDAGIAMNKGVLAKGISVGTDKTTWKYFLNLAGIKHATNNTVNITVIETGLTAELSPQLLSMHPYTRKELCKNGAYYNELIIKYPNDILYIKGCMYPVDIETAIAAADGTILNYNKDLVEIQEYTLINNLERYIKTFLNRWHVRAYTITDALYFSSIVGILFAHIPNEIINIRTSASHTVEAHTFDLENFFKSNNDLWYDVQVLKPETIRWLYKNLLYLQKHVGKQNTLDIIIDKIFNANKTGIGEYILRLPDPTFNDVNKDNIRKTAWDYSDIAVQTKALNPSFSLDNVEDFTVGELITLEKTALEDVPADTNLDRVEYVIETVTSTTERQAHDTVKTKALTVGAARLFKFYGVDLLALIIDYWMYYFDNNLYIAKIDYTEPNTTIADENDAVGNTTQYFSITPKVGFLLLLKQILYITKSTDLKLTTLKYHTVIDSDRDSFDTAVANSFDDGYSENILAILKDHLPDYPAATSTPELVGEYIQSVIDYYGLIWTLDSNSENTLVSSNIKNVLSKMIPTRAIDLTRNGVSYTIDELLALNGVKYTITSNFDINVSMRLLIKTFLNIEIDPYALLSERLTSFTNILNKLTSYTIQVINPAVPNDIIHAYYNTLQPLVSKKGIVAILDADLVPLEQEYVEIWGIGNDFRDRLDFYLYDDGPRVVACEWPINGIMYGFENDHTRSYNLIVDKRPVTNNTLSVYDNIIISNDGVLTTTIAEETVTFDKNALVLAKDAIVNYTEFDNNPHSNIAIIGNLTISYTDNAYELTDEITASTGTPIALSDFKSNYFCDIHKLKLKDQFLLGITGSELSALETEGVVLTVNGSDSLSKITTYSGNVIVPQSQLMDDSINGHVEILDGSSELMASNDNPLNTFTVQDLKDFDASKIIPSVTIQ